MALAQNRTSTYKPALFWFCIFALIWSGLLLFAGGLTTSIDAGMAFLDWPLSNGSVNPEGWLEDDAMRAEHSHRLFGAKLGLLSIGMLIWTWLREERAWVRKLALGLFLMVVAQGLLGGARVLFDQLNTGWDNNTVARTFAVLHAIGAQVTLALLVTLATIQSRFWIERGSGLKSSPPAWLRTLGIVTCAVILLQILGGAVVRHWNVGLTIYTFPHSTPDGDWLPQVWTSSIAINFIHRVGAVLATIAVFAFVVGIWRDRPSRGAIGMTSLWAVVIVGLQFTLGVITTMSRINPHSATTHMLAGALLFAVCCMLTLHTFNRPVPSSASVSSQPERSKNRSLAPA